MQAIMETLFDIIYLTTVITVGVLMIRNNKNNAQHRLFGFMAVILGFGDSFHLVPRSIALLTTGLDDYATALGIGKFITSITMTVFYILLYYVWRLRYKEKNTKGLTITIYLLAALRIFICFMPQNAWTNTNAPLLWGIYRNIPFAAMGIIIILLFYRSANKFEDNSFRFMWLTIVLSFVFYIPVVLFADTVPIIGVLMIPKTCAYVWSVMIGYNDLKKS